jgi:hypothetical protein
MAVKSSNPIKIDSTKPSKNNEMTELVISTGSYGQMVFNAHESREGRPWLGGYGVINVVVNSTSSKRAVAHSPQGGAHAVIDELIAKKHSQLQHETRAFALLDKAVSVQDGWDGYNAPAPNSWSKKCCMQLLQLALKNDMYPKNISPYVSGGIGITFKRADKSKLYLEILNKEEIYLMDTQNPLDPEIFNLTASGLDDIVEVIKSKLNE